MADKTQDNDEYEFVDYDNVNPLNESDRGIETDPTEFNPAPEKNTVIRNALIVVLLVFLAIVVYKFAGTFFTKKETLDASIPAVNQPIANNTAGTSAVSPIDTNQTSELPVSQTTVSTTTPPPETTVINVPTQASELNQLNQKVSAVELNQQNIRSEIARLNEQLNSINTNISEISVKINNLAQIITAFSATLEKQSTLITTLTVVKQKPKVKRVVRRVIKPRAVYYIQAVIPGRAWLIASNGSTLTVREGTTIPGYGVVKLIDPSQGRILTTSGQIIRFSQQDS